LKSAKTQSFSLNWIKIKNSILGSGSQLLYERLENITNLLGTKPVYSEETSSWILVVLSRNRVVTQEQILSLQNYLGKRVKVIKEGDEEGLLVGLKNEHDNFLGIGILDGVDYKRRLLKIYTPVNQLVSFLYIGQIKLDKNCKEIGLSSVYSN
jgi:polynucleotide 5'-kinase involved in rRNA processing